MKVPVFSRLEIALDFTHKCVLLPMNRQIRQKSADFLSKAEFLDVIGQTS
jgi:hypothetical protein